MRSRSRFPFTDRGTLILAALLLYAAGRGLAHLVLP